MPRAESKLLTPLTRWILRAVIFILSLYTVVLTSLYFLPGLSILPYASRLKKSPFCSTWKAVTDVRIKVKQTELARQIRARR